MKTEIVIIIISALLTMPFLAESQISADDPEKTIKRKIEWDATNHDFQTVKAYNQVKHKFSFTNNSDEPVLISRVKSSCGCTVAGYQKKPVAPDSTGTVSVAFRYGRTGNFRKSVVVQFGSGEKYFLVVKGTVEK